MNVEQLNAKLIELKREAMNLRFQKTSGELEKTHRVGQVRRLVARIKTVLNNPQKEGNANA
mgnify:CR=1 FL=1